MKVYVILDNNYEYSGVKATLEEAEERRDRLIEYFSESFRVQEEEI